MEKNQLRLAFWLTLAAALSLASCSQGNEQGKKKKGDKQGASENDAGDDESNDDSQDKSKGGDEADDLPDLGEGEGADDGDAAAKLTEDCGGKGLTDQDPDKVIYQKDLEALPITKTKNVILLNVTATVVTKLGIKVTGKTTVQDTDIEITKLVPDNGLTRPTAEKEAATNAGKTTLTNVPFKDYPNLSEDKQWDGVLCTFVPATKVVNERGGKKTVATFDPPLPSSVSPRANAARYKEEIGDKRSFKGIKATIKESDSTDLKGEDEISGDVIVEKVDPEADVDDGQGGTKTIKADVAYKVTYDFGDAKKTFALGLPPEVTYYISYAKHDLVANVVDTTATGANGAVVTFIHK